MGSWPLSLLFAWAVLLWTACGERSGTDEQSCDMRATRVEELAAHTFEQMDPAEESLRVLARAYADFANRCHEHPLAPEMLFRRADILLGLGKPQEALAQYRDIHDNFGQFDKRAQCAFLMGFIYDAHLGDRVQATKVYREVLALYPRAEAAVWATQALVFLGEHVEPEPTTVQIDLGF